MTSGVHQIIDRQIRHWEMEARAREAALKESPDRPLRFRPWVTVSRAIGAGGSEIARGLAARLNFHVVDREIVEVLVREQHSQRALIESLDERDRSSLDVWVESLLHGHILYKGDYLRTLMSVLHSIALHGRVVIMGRGANFILQPDHGLHVRVTAPFSKRVAAVMQRLGVSRDEAERRVSQTDQEKSAFIQGYFHHSIDDPLGYDLILNMAGLENEPAVDLVEQTLRRKLAGRADVDF